MFRLFKFSYPSKSCPFGRRPGQHGWKSLRAVAMKDKVINWSTQNSSMLTKLILMLAQDQKQQKKAKNKKTCKLISDYWGQVVRLTTIPPPSSCKREAQYPTLHFYLFFFDQEKNKKPFHVWKWTENEVKKKVTQIGRAWTESLRSKENNFKENGCNLPITRNVNYT